MTSGAQRRSSIRSITARLAAVLIVLLCVAGGIWWFILKIDSRGPLRWVSTVAGLNREFGEPFGIATRGREIYVSDGDAGKIWVIRDGEPTVFADGFATPSAIAFDKDNDLVVADSGSHTIKRVSSKGEVSVLAGMPGKSGSTDGAADSALFDAPIGLAVANDGRIFVADTYNDRIRVIDNGMVTTLAGSVRGYADGPSGDAKFDTPTGVALWQDKLLVADTGNRRIRVIEPDGRVWTLTGDGRAGLTDGLMLSASFVRPTAMAVDPEGKIYVTDGNAVRQIGGAPLPTVKTISAKDGGLSDGYSLTARFSRPSGLAFTQAGDLVVADSDNRLIRQISSEAGGHLISMDEKAALRETAEEFRSMQPGRWPYDPPDAVREIAATFGEIRGEIPEGKDIARFHNGVDIAGAYGETARFVRTEKVLRPLAAEGFGTLRESIRMPTMAYVHVRLGRDAAGVPFDDPRFKFEYDSMGKLTGVRVPRGSAFTAGEPVGTLNQRNHVHLIAGRTGSEINPLDALVLPNMTDTTQPVIENVSLYDESWQPLETAAADQRITLAGKARIIIRAYDQVDGNLDRRRLGVYRVGYQLLNADLSPAGEMRWTIRFDRMPPAAAVKLVYGAGSRSGAAGETVFNYIATDEVEGERYQEGFLDPAGIAPGTYVLRAMVRDEAGNTAQKDITIDITK
jgi:DNA-binding beta-propeller fold protein YncE